MIARLPPAPFIIDAVSQIAARQPNLLGRVVRSFILLRAPLPLSGGIGPAQAAAARTPAIR
jgi:hypothetical protein